MSRTWISEILHCDQQGEQRWKCDHLSSFRVRDGDSICVEGMAFRGLWVAASAATNVVSIFGALAPGLINEQNCKTSSPSGRIFCDHGHMGKASHFRKAKNCTNCS